MHYTELPAADADCPGQTPVANMTANRQDSELADLHDTVEPPRAGAAVHGAYTLLSPPSPTTDTRPAAATTRLNGRPHLPMTEEPIKPPAQHDGEKEEADDASSDEDMDPLWWHSDRASVRDRATSFSTIALDASADYLRRKLSFASSLGLNERQDTDQPGKDEKLWRISLQALPSLLISVIGLMLAGWLLDIVQHWEVFARVSQLFILVPVLLGLKGNLEMNLASRMSTAANLGDLDTPQSQRMLVWGNLALLQLQALSVSCLAGLLSMLMGMLSRSADFNFRQVMLVSSSAMICASVSSGLLGVSMCGLCIVCRRYGINPDNVATPIAASFGDLITLAILSLTSRAMLPMIDTWLPTCLFIIMLLSLPLWLWLIQQNAMVRETVWDGWVPILLAMVISSLAGIVLERYMDQYIGMAVLVPVLNGVSGNLSCVFASRISTALHARRRESYLRIGIVLFLLNLPVQWPFLGAVRLLQLGHGSMTGGLFIAYTLASMLLVASLLCIARWIVTSLWKRGFDPDNYALPYITAIGDVAGTILLVIAFRIVHSPTTSTAAAP